MFDLSLLDNPILNTDSYKFSHRKLYPADATALYSYIESRGGEGDETIYVGPQMLIKRYLSQPITRHHVYEAKELLSLHFGEEFDETPWLRLVNKHGGRWPVRIKAVKEGTRVKKHNVLASVQDLDPEFVGLGSHLEACVLRANWYPTTVATNTFECKRILHKYLKETSDLTGDAFVTHLEYMLHDFGARGASSKETAEIGGVGHLVNFRGTDTLGGVAAAKVFYCEPCAGNSIPASEHSAVTSWGRYRELDFYRNQLVTFGKAGKIFSSVIDSYNQYRAISEMWGGALKEDLIKSGARLVLRPDSGDPIITVPRLLEIAGSVFGFTVNSKGYKLLPPYVGMIQGDGITKHSLPAICEAIKLAGWSLQNMVFGMGGGLLQLVSRDDNRFAMKGSAIYRRNGHGWSDDKPEAGEWMDMYKDPIDDPGKQSKRGRLGLYLASDGSHYTDVAGKDGDQLETIFEYELKRDQSFSSVRMLADEWMMAA